MAEFDEVLGPARGFRGGGAGAAEGLSQEMQALNQHRRNVSSAYGALNEGGVRQGSLYPPTDAQRERVEAAREALDAYRSGRG
jgi:hypothetical protein